MTMVLIMVLIIVLIMVFIMVLILVLAMVAVGGKGDVCWHIHTYVNIVYHGNVAQTVDMDLPAN